MQYNDTLTQTVNRVRYRVATATLLADDCYWDGHNYERGGRNTFLFRSPTGRYFIVAMSQWQGEPHQQIIPMDEADAEELYNTLEKRVGYTEAFPSVTVLDA